MKTFNFLSGQIKALLETKHHMQLPNDILQFILSELSTSMAPVMLNDPDWEFQPYSLVLR